MARRNRRGDGTTYQEASGQWFAAITKSGKRIKRRAKSKSHALRILNELRRETGAVRVEKMRVGDWLDRWLKECESACRPNTVQHYRSMLRHIDSLRPVLLAKLQPHQVQDAIDAISTSATRRAVFVAVKRCFNRAREMGCVEVSPVAPLIKPKHEPKKLEPFTVSECTKILTATEDHVYAGVFALGLVCGLRISEILALEWQHWTNDEIEIVQQVQRKTGGYTVGPPKSKAGVRTVPLTGAIESRLLDRKKHHLRLGLSGCNWIFPTRRGGLQNADNFRNRHWNPLLKSLEIEHRGFHHTRHTAASLMLSEVPLHAVSKILGHEKVSTTLDIYAHWITENNDQVRAAMKRIGG